MAGQDKGIHRLVVSRFPADNGILVEEGAGSLSVEFIEKIFMKSLTSYKAAVYFDAAPDIASGEGAVDKQINHQERELSEYWIKDFLRSELFNKAAAGTSPLARALRSVAQKTDDLDIKARISSAAMLAPGMEGRPTSLAQFAQQMVFPDDVVEKLRLAAGTDKLFTNIFTFDITEFKRHISFRSIELDNGAVFTAPAEQFDNVFVRENLEDGRVRYSAQGRIVNQKVRAGAIPTLLLLMLR